jgi:hypothetical protein
VKIMFSLIVILSMCSLCQFGKARELELDEKINLAVYQKRST